ncbi:MAG: thiol reductase thioredoxin [Acidobacteriota bacterium]
MRAYVFTDKRLASRAGQFVWLSINTEKDVNKAWNEKFPITAWPTMLVVNPKDEEVVLRYLGSATVPELEVLLDDGKRSVDPSGKPTPLDAALAEADRFYGASDFAKAIPAYGKALEKAPKGWAPYGRAVGSWLFALSMEKRYEDCARGALDAYAKTEGTPASMGIAGGGLDCALSLPAEAKGRKELIADLQKKSLASLEHKSAVAADDVSGLYMVLISSAEDAKDEENEKKLEGDWVSFLEDAASKATNPDARAVFDPHRLSAYIETGHPEKAVPMLQQSEKDLPEDYNPPARLAIAYKEMKKWDDAIAASDRALAKVYGPRKLVVLNTRADIYDGKGDAAAAKKTIDDAIAFAKTLPKDQGERWVANLTKKMEKIGKPSGS